MPSAEFPGLPFQPPPALSLLPDGVRDENERRSIAGAMFPRWLVIAVLFAACAHPPARKSERIPRVDFARQVRPILEARYQPCHFPGGRMYEALPFDREETIHRLGDRLFTRIKAEDEQRVIGELLSQGR